MPITLLDIILIGVMLISALLAMIRGFMREVLSIAAWVIAARGDTLFLCEAAAVREDRISTTTSSRPQWWSAAHFCGTLLIVSVITVRFSDMVLDSRIGALDRTLGFLFGLARGLIIVVVAFLFFAWLVPDRSQPEWVRSAKSRVVLQGTGDWLMSMLPEDPESTILKRLKKPKPEEEEPRGSAQRSGSTVPRGCRVRRARPVQPAELTRSEDAVTTLTGSAKSEPEMTDSSPTVADLESRRRPAARGVRRLRHIRASRCGRHHRARPACAPAPRPGGRRHRLFRRQAVPFRTAHGARRRQLLPPRGDRAPARHLGDRATCAIRPPARPSCATCSRCSPSSTAAALRSAITAI